MAVFDSKVNVEHFARSVPFDEVQEKEYNLSVSCYVEAKDNRELTDITQLNAELRITVARIEQMRQEINTIVAEIEGQELEA